MMPPPELNGYLCLAEKGLKLIITLAVAQCSSQLELKGTEGRTGVTVLLSVVTVFSNRRVGHYNHLEKIA